MADDREGIEAEVLKSPDKEYYSGFFREFFQIKVVRRAREVLMTNLPAPGSAMATRRESDADTALKVHLIAAHRRKQPRA